jgi:hypothetical protein
LPAPCFSSPRRCSWRGSNSSSIAARSRECAR